MTSKEYDISQIDDITVVKFFLSPNNSVFESIIDYLALQQIYHKRLWDLSCVDFQLSAQELIRIAQYGKSKFPEPNRAAITFKDNSFLVEMRIFLTLRNERNKSEFRIFDTHESALNWLYTEELPINKQNKSAHLLKPN